MQALLPCNLMPNHLRSPRVPCRTTFTQPTADNFSSLPLEAPISRRHPPSRLGPKSQGQPLFVLSCFLRFLISQGGLVDARVGGKVTNPSGAETISFLQLPTRSAKPSEFYNPGPVTPAHSTVYEQLSRTGKRSFHRALRRATRDGSTFYRGRLHTVQSLGINSESSPSPHPCPIRRLVPTRRPSGSSSPSARWRAVSWNAGGLSSDRLAEIEQWLQRCEDRGSPVQICILLETHWGFDSEWMMKSYHALHGGLNRKQAGILVLIHKTFIASQGIRSASIVPGRLLQIRLDTEPAITVFAVYQTVWADGSKQETSLTHRELLWSKLDSAIKGVSKRSQLLIAGDLNTPCLSHPPNVGPSVLATPANVKQKDQHRLQQLLLQHNLIALNTWGRRKYCHTYQFETAGSVHRTQIDFLLFRAQHSEALAKSARTIQAPFVPPTGMRHLPLLVSLPKPEAPRTRSSGGVRVTASEVASSLRQDPALIARFQQEVRRLHSGNIAGDPAQALNQAIQQAWKIVKPPPAPTHALPNPTTGLVLQLWTLHKQRNHAEFAARASFMRKWLLAFHARRGFLSRLVGPRKGRVWKIFLWKLKTRLVPPPYSVSSEGLLLRQR